MIRVAIHFAWVAATLAVAPVLAGNHPAPPAPKPAPPHVVLAVWDACRPDKMGCYGFERDTTPAIDRLAADPDSALFERHYVQGDWTKPSTASLFSGEYVSRHRVVLGSEPSDDPQINQAWSQVLPEEVMTLAERFRQAGYKTVGLTRIPHTNQRYGFRQGFTIYNYPPGDPWIFQEAVYHLQSARQPVFIYLHFSACHDPFPVKSRDTEYVERFRFKYNEGLRKQAGVDFGAEDLYLKTWRGDLSLEPDDVRFLNLIYEAKLRSVDRGLVEPFLRKLRQDGVYDNSLLIFTADHGTELYEHERLAHGHALWEQVIHVPLIVKFPKGKRPASLKPRYTELSRAIDVYPSLLAAAGIEPTPGLPGRNLFEGAKIPHVLAERSENNWALILGSYKVIQAEDGRRRVFDLAKDPGESRDVSATHTETVQQALEIVNRLRREFPSRQVSLEEVDAPTPEEIEILRSLGYVE